MHRRTRRTSQLLVSPFLILIKRFDAYRTNPVRHRNNSSFNYRTKERRNKRTQIEGHWERNTGTSVVYQTSCEGARNVVCETRRGSKLTWLSARLVHSYQFNREEQRVIPHSVLHASETVSKCRTPNDKYFIVLYVLCCVLYILCCSIDWIWYPLIPFSHM